MWDMTGISMTLFTVIEGDMPEDKKSFVWLCYKTKKNASFQ